MTKEEHIQYWIKTAKKDWKLVNKLFGSKDYLYCLFFAHLVLEKLSKAHWVKDNESNYPPRIHNLIWIIKKTNLQFTEEQLAFLKKMNDFQIEGRYPDYMMKIYKICNFEYTKSILQQVKSIKKCLQEKLP
ncbi:MAG: HEPN domain-containing protein [Bacteroidetes bacterium]|nr:HEPN domain-containing protein [Bacteroidota bacterium]